MSLPITPDVIEGAYEFLRRTEPFDDWNLPDSEEMKFSVLKTKKDLGWYRPCFGYPHKHEIWISGRHIGHTMTLITIVAHEMIHLHQQLTGMVTSGVDHNAAFHRLAKRVCRIHGFDPKLF